MLKSATRLNAFCSWVRSTVRGQRLLLAAKTAVAVGIAWWLAPLMPGDVDKFPYYAPLGVLVSMSPTFIGSVRNGMQTLAGLLLGIGLASGVLLWGTPNVLTISLAVGASVLLASLPRLGAGREYVPVATLLVLIIGGSHADVFSLGYALQMGLGVLVGLIVNLTVFPPLTLDSARGRIHRLRSILIDQLEEAAAALVERWPPTHEEWAGRRHTLDDAVVEVRDAVHHAAESQHANPRARLRSRHRVLADSYEDLAALEIITFHIRDLSEVLASTVWAGPLEVNLRESVRGPMANSLETTAAVLRAWEAGSIDPDIWSIAAQRLSELKDALAASDPTEVSALVPGAAVALDIQRILTALQHRLGPENPKKDTE